MKLLVGLVRRFGHGLVTICVRKNENANEMTENENNIVNVCDVTNAYLKKVSLTKKPITNGSSPPEIKTNGIDTLKNLYRLNVG